MVISTPGSITNTEYFEKIVTSVYLSSWHGDMAVPNIKNVTRGFDDIKQFGNFSAQRKNKPTYAFYNLRIDNSG